MMYKGVKSVMDYYDVAEKILLEIKAIATCDAHEDFHYQTGMDEKEIYAWATNLFKKYYPICEDFSLFHDCVKKVLDDTAMDNECPYCYKISKE